MNCLAYRHCSLVVHRQLPGFCSGQPKTFVFPSGERSSSGLLEWESKSDALETLGFLNHYQMKNPSEYLCVLQSSPLWPSGLAGFRPELSFLPSGQGPRDLLLVIDTGRWDLVARRAACCSTWEGQPSCLLPPSLPAWELLRLVLQGAGILCASEAGSHNTQGKGSCTRQQVKFPYPLPGQAYPCAPAEELGMGSFLQLRKRRRNALCIWLVFESQNGQG